MYYNIPVSQLRSIFPYLRICDIIRALYTYKINIYITKKYKLYYSYNY